MATKTNRGGVIPYFIDGDEIKMLFMKPSNDKFGGSDYQIAKGKIEDGEDIKDGAFREAEEELGLFVPNTTDHKKLGTFLGRTTVFLARVKDPSDKMFGDTTNETKSVKWMTNDEFQQSGRTLHRAIVNAAVRAISKKK